MPNRLAGSTSPYLLQHQHNPVDWYPWGEEALKRAKREDRPIFLSIGYAACHWCHVMERESFENPEIATLLNERFVCIKVDREERPDLDQIYMTAVQMLSGSGGWPMSVFLTPQGEPFYGGTYFPPRPRHGLPGFGQLAMAIGDAWLERRADVEDQAHALTSEVRQSLARPETNERGTANLSLDLLYAAGQRLLDNFDAHWGGFGGAPKFPHCGDLELLLRLWKRTGQGDYLRMVEVTLQRMAAGGIFDHLGGGFARYSVDRQWLVPHFEKMLYDNGQLATLYLRAYQATGKQEYADVATATLEYMRRDLLDSQGGFHSSEDADSEGVEGKFYVWTTAEIGSLLGIERGDVFCAAYGARPHGNFEGFNILHLPQSLHATADRLGISYATLQHQLAADRAVLLAARGQRVRPGKDDKVLTSWNALAIEAFALAGRVLGRPDYIEVAETATRFIFASMRRPDGRLLHAWREGKSHLDGYLDDYAYLADACITLFETTGKIDWLNQSIELAETMLAHFRAPDGGLFYTADDHEALIARSKDYVDASIPSSAGSAAQAWLRLSLLTGDPKWHGAAEAALIDAGGLLRRQPAAAARFLHALDWYLGPHQQVVAIAEQPHAMERIWPNYFGKYRPHSVLAPVVATTGDDTAPAIRRLLEGRTAIQGQPTLYVCENFRCQTPKVGFELD